MNGPANEASWLLLISTLTFLSVLIFVRYGWTTMRWHWMQREQKFDRVLNQQLLLQFPPRVAMILSLLIMAVLGVSVALIFSNPYAAVLGMGVGYFIPAAVLSHLEQQRSRRLDLQLVDAITTLSSGVRAGLTLVQSIELLVNNSIGPVKQEFAQLLREYSMGLDFNQAMRNTANRIGSSNYRLLFTAIEMHRQRGGNTGESLDRIAESIREILRLEGKLDAITAQGRAQATMMAAAPMFIMTIYWAIDPEGVNSLFAEPMGRVLLLVASVLVLIGFLWIRRIMQVDI